MPLRFLFTIVSLAMVAAFLGWKGSAMRKKIPSQEVVPFNQAIAVINGESGDFADRLRIKIVSEANHNRKLAYNKNGICLIEGLSNQNHYTIELEDQTLKVRFYISL